jgi:hypothetical protein
MESGRSSYQFTLVERPWTVNAERAGNRQAPSTLTDAVVEVRLTLKGRLQDTSACLPAVKAAIDGLVDGGLFLDDTGDHVKCIVFWAPVKAKVDALTIFVEGIETDRAGYTQPK